METKILFSGLGGQGVMLIGKLFSQAVCTIGKNVVFNPSYGAEQRGGVANATVIVSENEIGAPNIETFDILLAMSDTSFAQHKEQVKTGGIILYLSEDSVSDEITDRGAHIIRIPARKLAENAGTGNGLNFVMLGALLSVDDAAPMEVVLTEIENKFHNKREVTDSSVAAVKAGFQFGRQAQRAK